MALIAEVESRQWLCDLGFGSYGIVRQWLWTRLMLISHQDFDTFRLSRSAEGEYLLQAKVAGEWARQYGFDLTPQEWIDFVPANYLNSAPGHFCAEACGGAASTGGTRDFREYAENHYGEGTETRAGGGRYPRILKERFALIA
jgi:N-hydroxyarylamine O-acetyltransferase